jgi:PAS domain S-box-containing protein
MPDNERAGETSIKRDLGGLEERGGGFVEAVEGSRMPMLITDAQEPGTPIIYANPAFLGMLGLKQGEVIGHDYATVTGQHVDPETLESTTERMASHIASIHDFLLRRQDGREMWVSQSIDPIIMEGRIVRHFAAFYDITDWVLREQQIRGEKGALERRFNARARKLQQTTERLEEEIERRIRLAACRTQGENGLCAQDHVAPAPSDDHTSRIDRAAATPRTPAAASRSGRRRGAAARP